MSFRVSKSQRELIEKLADRCGYEPKARLTPAQTALRDELIIARSDYAKYTSMLNAMPQSERMAIFRNQPWMIEALRRFDRIAELITEIINKYFSPNHVPGTSFETDKEPFLI